MEFKDFFGIDFKYDVKVFVDDEYLICEIQVILIDLNMFNFLIDGIFGLLIMVVFYWF